MRPRRHDVTRCRAALPGVEAFSLWTEHAFPRHAHDQFGVGVVTSGAQRSWSGIGPVEAEAGDVITVNPGEIHDGRPHGCAARAWRMLYLELPPAPSRRLPVGDAPEAPLPGPPIGVVAPRR